ncbi:MAG: hypothetical protein ACI4JG_09260 [Acutalibacteraceae bacterium]
MKKALSFFAVFILIIAAGCERKNPGSSDAPTSPPSFTANLKVTYGDAVMTAAVERKSKDEFKVKMLSPEIMKPLELTYSAGVCTVTYDGLKFETDLSRFPQASFGALLAQTFEEIEQGIDIEKTYSDGIWTYRGTGERGVFVLTQDAETGAWLELEIEGAPLHAEFSDFVIK